MVCSGEYSSCSGADLQSELPSSSKDEGDAEESRTGVGNWKHRAVVLVARSSYGSGVEESPAKPAMLLVSARGSSLRSKE